MDRHNDGTRVVLTGGSSKSTDNNNEARLPERNDRGDICTAGSVAQSVAPPAQVR